MRAVLFGTLIVLFALAAQVYSHGPGTNPIPEDLVEAVGPRAIIGSGHDLQGYYATITGGLECTNLGVSGVIAGGKWNLIDSLNTEWSTISGGQCNLIFEGSDRSTICGGAFNWIEEGAWGAAINGGVSNVVRHQSFGGWIGGGLWNHVNTNSPFASIGAGIGNHVDTNAAHASIGGGWYNLIEGADSMTNASVILGGWTNYIGFNSEFSVIGGGKHNIISPFSSYGTILGGAFNKLGGYGSSDFATVLGGRQNLVESSHSFIGGGDGNSIYSYATGAAIGGGTGHLVYGEYSVIPGGDGNLTFGLNNFAAGSRSWVLDNGTFMWADTDPSLIFSDNVDQFIVRARGGLWFGTTSSPSIPAGRFINTSTGGYLSTTGIWEDSSDREKKENFRELNNREILRKVAELPISTWNYKAEDEAIRHIGPTAQDFHAAFGLGADDKTIAPIDESGVSFAALQGFHEITEEKDAEIARLTKAIATLEKQMASMKERRAKWETRFGALEEAAVRLGGKAGANTMVENRFHGEGGANGL